jgi:hypothetical protein
MEFLTEQAIVIASLNNHAEVKISGACDSSSSSASSSYTFKTQQKRGAHDSKYRCYHAHDKLKRCLFEQAPNFMKIPWFSGYGIMDTLLIDTTVMKDPQKSKVQEGLSRYMRNTGS